jgi:hypothetical protein
MSSTGSNSGNPPPAVDVLIAAIAGRQHGLITFLQLLAVGLSRGAIAARVRTGRLHRVGRGVYGVGHARLSQEGRWLAAVLAGGEGSVLGYLSAAVLFQAWRRKVEGIDVVSTRRRRQEAGIRVHRCRNLDPRDVTTYRGIPVTTMARTLVDLTDVLTPHQLANVIHEAAFRRRFHEPATRAAMARAQGRKLSVLEAALAMHNTGSAGTKSDLEDRFLAQVQLAGLEPPLVNAGVRTPHQQFEVDFLWPDKKLVVEVDGHGHDRPRTQQQDAERDRALQKAGYEVARVTPPPPPHPAADPRPP